MPYTGNSKNQFGLKKPKGQRDGQLKGDKVSKYKTKKAVKGQDKVLNVDYLKKVFQEKDKMELKLSTFDDNTVNDEKEMSTGVIGDTVESDLVFFQPTAPGCLYISNNSPQFGYQEEDAGYMLLQYGQNLTPAYAAVTGCYPTGSFSWQSAATIEDNFEATNDWGQLNKDDVIENANNKLEGEYITLKRSIYNLVITMDTLTYDRDLTDAGEFAGTKPTEFRVLHLTSKRKISNQGDSALNALENLWLLPTGRQGGLSLSNVGRAMNNPPFRTDQGFSPEEMFDMPVDKSYYYVHSDQNFTLQNAAQSLSAVKYVSSTSTTDYLINQSTVNNKYPAQRKLNFVVNYDTTESERQRGNSKVQLALNSTPYVAQPSGDPLNYYFMEPKDMNFKDIIIILSKKVGTTQPNTSGSAQLWTAAGYGTLSAYDN